MKELHDMIKTIDEEEDAKLKKMAIKGSIASPDAFYIYKSKLVSSASRIIFHMQQWHYRTNNLDVHLRYKTLPYLKISIMV